MRRWLKRQIPAGEDRFIGGAKNLQKYDANAFRPEGCIREQLAGLGSNSLERLTRRRESSHQDSEEEVLTGLPQGSGTRWAWDSHTRRSWVRSSQEVMCLYRSCLPRQGYSALISSSSRTTAGNRTDEGWRCRRAARSHQTRHTYGC